MQATNRDSGSSGGLGGVFGALLDTVSSVIERATGVHIAGNDNETPSPPATGFTTPGTVATTAADQLQASASASASNADTRTVLGTLGEALSAIDKALARGGKPDKADLDKLDKALNALAGILNAAPAPTTGDPTTAGDPTTKGGSGNSLTLDARSVLDLLAGRLPDKLAALAGNQSADLSKLSVPVDPKSLLAGLSGKLGDLSEALKQADPDLADKLAALGKQLGSSTALDAGTLEKLGFKANSTGADLASALSAKTAGGAGAPQNFAPAKLDMPAESPLSGKPQAGGDAGSAQGSTQTQAAQTVAPAGDSAGAKSGGDGGSGQPETKDKAAIIRRAASSAPATSADPGQQAGPAAAQAASAATAGVPAAFKPVQAAYQATASQINFAPLAITIAHHAVQGTSQFQMRLDPPDLGRVDVKMHMDASGTLNAHMTVDRADTLDLMQRDRSQLQRALMQAGVDASKTSLQFSLNQNPSSGQNGAGQQRPSYNFTGSQGTADVTDPTPALRVSVYSATVSPSGVNLFV